MTKSKRPEGSTACNVCGKRFSRGYSSGVVVCPECAGDRNKAMNRIFTRDTVFLICKWYDEGMTVNRLANLLQRSEENIKLALSKGGINV